jgi:2-octaprenyl-6-methoxyphenol hydroxylase
MSATLPTPPSCGTVLIAGAGPVGAACALLLARGGWPVADLHLVDARPAAAGRDSRAIALNHGSRVLLESAGAWPADATPITTIHVSQRGRLGRTVIDRLDHGVPALGYVVAYDRLMQALDAALDAAGVQVRHGVPARPLATSAGILLAELGTERVPADVFIAAEGGAFGEQDARRRRFDYGQSAIVATVQASDAPAGWAYERFTAHGPIALLPQQTPQGPRHCLVWCGLPLDGARRQAMEPQAFAAELHQQFGDRVGRFTLAGPRAVFPLGLNTHDTLVEGRVVRIGNAAQTLHPVAGQGLNLGLRDAACLAQELLLQGAGLAALHRFADRRRLDRGLTTRLTDWMARSFATPFAPMQHLLGGALGLLDFTPGARAMLSRHLMVGQR